MQSLHQIWKCNMVYEAFKKDWIDGTFNFKILNVWDHLSQAA